MFMSGHVSQTILLVEDEENDVAFMRYAMKSAGLAGHLKVVEDGGEAIAYLSGQGPFSDRAQFPLPVLIFLDLKLPKVMGMDVLKWIRERPEFDLTMVIVLTSSQQATDIREAYSAGTNSYLVKPSNPLDLGEVVRLAKRYWLELNQPTVAYVGG